MQIKEWGSMINHVQFHELLVVQTPLVSFLVRNVLFAGYFDCFLSVWVGECFSEGL